MKTEKYSTLELLKDLAISPQKFFKRFEKQAIDKLPLFIPVAIVFALAKGIDRLDDTIAKHVISGGERYEMLANMTWLYYWGLAIFAGIIGGLVIYELGSWFYNLRIKWSGGKDSKALSKKIYLYSFFFVGITRVIATILDTFYYSTPIDVQTGDLSSNVLELPLMILLLVLLYHSIFISYKTVKSVEGMKKWKTMIWFAILPVFIYTLGILALFGAMLFLL